MPLALHAAHRHPSPRTALGLRRAAQAAITALGLALCLPSSARPPDHAPAHGWRAKQADSFYMGYSGRHWKRDYGVVGGRCLWRDVGTAVGAATGAAVGSQVGAGDGRALAIFVGTVLGAAIGNRIGADLDAADRGCVGHALELAADGRAVRWTNAATGVAYAVVPLASRDGGVCRSFELTRSSDGRSERSRQVACRDDVGRWQLRG